MPGRMPRADPSAVPRSTGRMIERNSFMVSHRFWTFLTMTVRVCSVSRFRRISATPNMPTATETKLMPPYISRTPNVNRGVPV